MKKVKQADPDYGQRVRDGLDKVKNEMKEHTSSAAADMAMEKAEDMGHESDRY
jgi:catalase